MMEWLSANVEIVTWIVLGIIFIIAEVATVSVVSIWFVGGCAVALILAIAGVPVAIQVVAAIAVSAGLFFGCRKKLTASLRGNVALKEEDISSQAEGKIGVVTEAIEPYKNGQILIGGNYWTAKGFNEDDAFAVDTKVIVIRVEGLCCLVEAADASK